MEDTTLQKYWATVMHILHDGVMLVDTRGIILSVNKAFENLVGYSQKELIGQHCSLLQCSHCNKSTNSGQRHWCELFESSKINKQKCTVTHKNGHQVHVIKNGSCVQENTLTVGAVETLSDITDLVIKEGQIESYREELRKEDCFENILGTSELMLQTFNVIKNVAISDAPTLILGESGTGKELVAQAIHQQSARRASPYVKVNCAALNHAMLESELFGHAKGAFAGAYQDKAGCFETAHGGDIFLDEIGELPQSIQTKLLRALEENVIERLGDNRSIPVDVRVTTSTSYNIKELVETGAFRRDLYYRINVLPIEVPPLRNRSEDIPLLAEQFFRHLQLKYDKPIIGISIETMILLMEYQWPGNIRELKSAFEYSFIVCNEKQIMPKHLPPDILNGKDAIPCPLPKITSSMDEQKKNDLIKALEESGGNKSAAARKLGISRVTVWNQIHRYNIS